MAHTPDETKDRHHQHSMVLVPIDTAGVEIQRMLPVFGDYDAPHGHGEVHFKMFEYLLKTLLVVQAKVLKLHKVA